MKVFAKRDQAELHYHSTIRPSGLERIALLQSPELVNKQVRNVIRVSLVAFFLMLAAVGAQVAARAMEVSPEVAQQPYASYFLGLIPPAGVGLLSLICILLARLGRPYTGTLLLLSGTMLLMMLLPLASTGLGLLCGLLLVVSVSAVASFTLPSRWLSRVSGVAAAFGIASALLDYYAPKIVPVNEPTVVSQAVIIALLLVYAFFALSQFPTYSLRIKLIILAVAIALIPMSVMAYFNNLRTNQELRETALAKLSDTAQLGATALDKLLFSYMGDVRVEAQYPALVDYLNVPAARRVDSLEERLAAQVLQAMVRQDDVFTISYGLLDIQGENLLDTDSQRIGRSEALRDYFLTPQRTGLPYLSGLDFSGAAGSQPGRFYVSMPIRSGQNQVVGFLRVIYSVYVLQSTLRDALGEGQHSWQSILVDKSSNMILAYPDQPELVGSLYEGRGQGKQALAEVDLENIRWAVIVQQPESVILEPLQVQARGVVTLAILAAIFAVGAAVALAQVLTGPLVRLRNVAEQARMGDLTVEAIPESMDDVGRLAETFNAMTAQLRAVLSSLEQNVANRTRAIALSVAISRQLSNILDVDQLAAEVSRQLQEAFHYYHVHIYLFDESGENLVMRGGTGEAARVMLARGHSIPAGRGLAGRAAETRSVILVPDTRLDPYWLPNPLLPETQTEVAVPIITGQHVLGVLDVQQSVAGSLGTQDSELLLSIANQVAVAVRNAYQIDRVRQRAAHDAMINEITLKLRETHTVEEAIQLVVLELSKALKTPAQIRINPDMSSTLPPPGQPGGEGEAIVSDSVLVASNNGGSKAVEGEV